MDEYYIQGKYVYTLNEEQQELLVKGEENDEESTTPEGVFPANPTTTQEESFNNQETFSG